MSKPKRILFLTPQLPFPPEQGTAIRNYHLIAETAARYDVSLLSFVGEQERAEVEAMDAICSRVVTVPAPRRSMLHRLAGLVTSRDPDMAHRLASMAFSRTLWAMLAGEDYDIVQVEGRFGRAHV